MATPPPESRWRTAHTVITSILGVVLTGTLIATNAFGVWEKIRGAPETPSASPTTAAPPVVSGAGNPSAESPLTEDEAVGMAERKSSEWLAGWQERNVDALVSLAELPFVYRGEYVVSPSGLADKYSAAFSGAVDWAGGPVAGSSIDRIEPRTIGDLDDQGWHVRTEPSMDKLRLRDNDIAVAVYYSDPEVEESGGLTMLAFRRSARDVGLVGVVDIGE